MKESPFPAIPDAPPDPSIPWKPAAVVGRCETSGGHIVQPRVWPPPRKSSDRPDERPSIALQCKRCEAWLVLYGGETAGVTVLKPDAMAEPVKK